MRSKGICVMCRKRIDDGMLSAENIDGLWLCCSDCAANFLEEKKRWTPARWDELCKLVYEEHQCLCSKVT